jgi:hypothetical protein
LPGPVIDLQGPQDPTGVVRMNPVGRDRVDGPKLRIEGRQALLPMPFLQVPADCRVGSDGRMQAISQSPVVKA